MALAVNYEKFRQRVVRDEQLSHSCWLLLCLLLAVAGAAGTVAAISRGAASGIVLLSGGLTLVFIIAGIMTLTELLAVKAERPADRKVVSVLVYLVDQLGNRQEFVDEIANLLRQQGELYQYQAQALLLATRTQGISREKMKQLTGH